MRDSTGKRKRFLRSILKMVFSAQVCREKRLSEKQIWNKIKEKIAKSLNVCFAFLKEKGDIPKSLKLLRKFSVFLNENKIKFKGLTYHKGLSLSLSFAWEQFSQTFSIKKKYLDREKPLSPLDLFCCIIAEFPLTIGFLKEWDYYSELNISGEYSTKHGKKEHLISELSKRSKPLGIQLRA